ncbi:hypothetical protein WDV93_16905 [Pantoea ananatis]
MQSAELGSRGAEGRKPDPEKLQSGAVKQSIHWSRSARHCLLICAALRKRWTAIKAQQNIHASVTGKGGILRRS